MNYVSINQVENKGKTEKKKGKMEGEEKKKKGLKEGLKEK